MPGRSARRRSKREQKRLREEAALDEKILSGEPKPVINRKPKPESSDASRKYITDDLLLEVSVSYRNSMLMLAAVDTLKENNLLKYPHFYGVPEDKIEYLLKMVQTKSEVQMKSDIIIGFEEVKQLEAAAEFIYVKNMFNELKQVEAAAQYIYAKKMFNVGIRGGKKFMEIPVDKMRYVGPYHLACYVD